MIITRTKDFEEILDSLGNSDNIAVLGCSECATVCQTGGEEEVLELSKYLKEKNKNVTLTKVLSTPCNYLLTRKELKDELETSDVIISMSCGNGVQTIAELTSLPVLPANDTMFVGEKKRVGVFEENCRTCGDCILGRTAAICPVSRCSKGLLNGPCGGSKFGKCEVDDSLDCAWIEIYSRLDELGRTDLLEEISPLRSYADSSVRRTINNRRNRRHEKD